MTRYLDTNTDYFERHLDKIRRTVSLACIFLIVLATIPVAIARAKNGWDIATLIQLLSTMALIGIFAFVYFRGYKKLVGVIIYCIDMVLMSVVTLDPQGNQLIVLFFITPLLVAYLFFPARAAFLASVFSYVFLSYLFYVQYLSSNIADHIFEMVLIVFAGISSIVGLHVVIGLRYGIEKKLLDIAHTDALTGLPNRMYFDQRLAQELARSDRDHTTLCIGLIDLDHFKRVNDTYGHECGDRVLTQVAHLIADSIRASDTACRVGGEEIVVIMPNTNIDEAYALVERVRLKIQDLPIEWRQHRLEITISTGLTEYQPRSDHQSLYARADKALYQAKQQGRNLVLCASIN